MGSWVFGAGGWRRYIELQGTSSLGFLGGSDIGGSPMSGLVDDQTYWSLSETRKSELAGGPDMSEVQGWQTLELLRGIR